MARAALLLGLVAFAGSPAPAQDVPSPAVTELGLAAEFTDLELRKIQTLSPLGELPASPSNRYADDADAARLGQFLFFDPRLSADGKVSCATCHDPAQGWSDGRAKAIGVGELRRNAPTVLNAGYQRWFYWDGRADSLWAQSLQPVEAPEEMGSSRTALAHLLDEDPELRRAYESVFGTLPDFSDRARFPDQARPKPSVPTGLFDAVSDPVKPAESHPHYDAWATMTAEDQEAVNQVFAHYGKAMEAYERRLVAPPSPFDRFVAGIKEEDANKIAALSPSAQRGARIFAGRGDCMLCHFGPTLSDREFHNIGLVSLEGDDFDHGRPDGIKKVQIDPFNGRGAYSDAPSWDDNVKLRYLFYDEHVYGAYKTPSLRNVARTPPYFHDGRMATLREVLEFYSELPGFPPIGHREETMKAGNFSEQDLQDLEAFLRSLSSPPVDESLRKQPESPVP